MKKKINLLHALIENSTKVRAYDLSHLSDTEAKVPAVVASRKLTGSKMTKRTKQSGERVSYTFAL